jgi:hypothetical protein
MPGPGPGAADPAAPPAPATAETSGPRPAQATQGSCRGTRLRVVQTGSVTPSGSFAPVMKATASDIV